MKKDIASVDDIRIFVDRFYQKAAVDPLLGSVFATIDLPAHLPVMYSFWASVLLGDLSYKGNPLKNHLHLPIAREHFERWLALFTKTIDDNFEGEKAEEAKMRAHSIAQIFQAKMNL
jgi:hemoglobin